MQSRVIPFLLLRKFLLMCYLFPIISLGLWNLVILNEENYLILQFWCSIFSYLEELLVYTCMSILIYTHVVIIHIHKSYNLRYRSRLLSFRYLLNISCARSSILSFLKVIHKVLVLIDLDEAADLFSRAAAFLMFLQRSFVLSNMYCFIVLWNNLQVVYCLWQYIGLLS